MTYIIDSKEWVESSRNDHLGTVTVMRQDTSGRTYFRVIMQKDAGRYAV